MKRSTTVLQPVPANSQQVSEAMSRRRVATSSNRSISLDGATSAPTAVKANTNTAAGASPPMPSRRFGGLADSNNGSPSPARPDFSSFLTPRTSSAPAPKTTAASPPFPPQQQWPHDAAQSPRPSPSASGTPSRETPSRRRTQHIPVLSRGTPPRTATVAAVTTASLSGSPRYEDAHDPRQVQRLTAVSISPMRNLISKPALPATPSSAIPPTDNFGGRQAASEAVDAAAQPTSFAATSESTALASAAAWDRAKKSAAAKPSAKAASRHVGGAPPTLIPTKVSQVRLLSTREVTVANKPCTAETADAMLRAQHTSASTRARSPFLRFQVSEATLPLTFCTASRKSSVWSSDHMNRSAVLGASGATLAPSVTSPCPTWLENVDEEDTTLTGENTPVSATTSLTYPPAGGSSTALRSAAPVKSTPRTTAASTTTATAPEPAAVKSSKRRSDVKPTLFSAAAAADAKSERLSLTQGSTSQVKKSRDVTRSATNAAPSPAHSSPPQTPHKPTAVAVGAQLHTPKISSSASKTARSTPTRAAASPSRHPDALRGGPLRRATSTAGMPAPPAAAAAAAPVVPSAPCHATVAHSQRAATILSQTLSAVRPMAPVVHVRIRPVLPSIGESGNNRHVYFLDHENVMVTRTRPGISVANASLSMPPSSLVELTATRRSGINVQVVPALQLSNLDWRTLGSSYGARGAAAARNGGAAAAVGRGGGNAPASLTDAPRTAAMTTASPACLCGGDLALLRAPVPAESPMASKTSPAAAGAAVPGDTDGGTIDGVFSNTSPSLESLQPLSFPPPILAMHHNRTISWTSQGSEEHSPSSRLSCGSPSTSVSPQQLGMGLAGGGTEACMNLGTFASASRTRPWLTTFKSFTEDETPSAFTTPRELRAGSSSAGVCTSRTSGRDSSGSAARSRRGISASQRRAKGPGIERKPRYGGISLSAVSLATTRRNSAATTTAGVSPRTTATTSAPSPTSMRRRASRSILGASVSVSALSIPTMPKASGGATNGTKLTEEDADAKSDEARQHEWQMQRQQTPIGSNSVSASGAATGAEQHYRFEFVHDEEATQADVFEESVLRFADEALLAQNVAIICYGPTGSGKTYSMMGSQAQPPSAAPASSGATPLRAGGGAGHRSGGLSTSSTHSHPQPDSRGHTPHGRANAGETQRRFIDEAAAGPYGGGVERDAHAVEDDGEGNGTSWTRLGSSCRYDYVEHTCKGNGGSAATAVRRNHQRYPHSGGGGGLLLATSAMALESAAMTGSMAEMGILPRLVHTLLERRGEAITIRRDPGRDVAGRSTNSLQSTSRQKTTVKRAGGLSLTLRDLTFYGIELYMDELCDLLDPGKRPIRAVSDTGGLAMLCQRINEARDYRIRGSRGGSSHNTTQTARTGGGMAITSLADLRRAYRLAHGNRVTARHAKNDTSSRSHAIFLLQLDFDLIESTNTPRGGAGGGIAAAGDRGAAAPPPPSERVQRVHSYVAMVDLAGCERVKQTKVEGAALREAQYINKSLSALSSVVLSLHHHNAHVPYRDSKLTRLLRPCLEGGRVLTLVHVAPCSSTEALNTLKFADQIRHIHIPTHALTPTSSKHRELLDVFADLIDPMQGQWEAQVRQAQLQLDRLCADVRLSYFSRAVGALPHRTAARVSLASDVVSELSAVSEEDDSVSFSSGDLSQEEGPQPLTEDATEADKRRFALRTVMHRFMGPIHSRQRTTMRNAVRAIRRRAEQKVLAHRRQMQQQVDELQATLQKLTAANAKLAKENSTPLPRDPHALELSRRIRESTEELGEYAKEQAALISLTTALRQRLATQDDVEAAVDEQLHKVQHRTAQAMRTLSAAVAAHPPGGPPAESGTALPTEPTLPADSSATAALAMNTKDDPELRDIAHQQLSLAKELAALRLEKACFEIGTALWEGLWARAMRKEIITAMEVEVFEMERILLDRRALSIMMLMAGDADVDGEANTAALLVSPRSAAYPGNRLGSVERDERGMGVTTAEHQVATPPMHSAPHASQPRVQHLSPSVTPHSSLRGRLDGYVHSGAEPGDRSSGVATPQGSANKGEGGAAVPFSPSLPQRSRRDRAVDLAATTTSDRSLSSATELFSAIASSSEGLRLRSALAAAAALPSPPPRRGLEGPMPNPLTVLVAEEQQKQPPNHMASASSPPFSCKSSTAAAVMEALMPLSLAGSYEEEQSMQEACLQLMLREGIPCEVCCLGESASQTLQHFILPSSADAPLAEVAEHEEPTSNSSAAPARYRVTAAAAAAPGATEKGGDASSLLSGQRHASAGARGGSSSVRPCERPGGPKVPFCTTRHGRLRLVRMPRRPSCYVLEFVYTHQALPMTPRLRAAMLGKPEDKFTSLPGKTHLEQMVDSLPTVQGVAGRGGGGGSSGSTAIRPQGPLREHRLFAIPLFEPTLHLHVHVLEEGIPNMTTPVAATVGLPGGIDAHEIAGSTFEDPSGHIEPGMSASPSSSLPALCVARRLESGPQLVIEVRGVPQAASTCRPVFTPDSKKSPKSSQQHQQKPHPFHNTPARAGSTARLGLQTGKPQHAIGRSPSQPSTSSQRGSTPSASPAPTGAGTAVWSGLVLAKRLSGGGELMLPSSCILSNMGCCSLVLRFPAPFFASSASRVERVEALVGALCGILRPSLTAPEVRASSSLSPSKRVVSVRRRPSSSPRSTSAGGAEKGGSNGGGRQVSSGSRLPLPCVRAPPELEVVNYAHVPYNMFLPAASATQTSEVSAANLGDGVEGVGCGLHTPGRPCVPPGHGAAPTSTSSSIISSDSLDGLGAMGGGVLGHMLQSSCSHAHRRHSATVMPPDTCLPQHTTTLNGALKPFRGNSRSSSPAAPLMDQQSSATLQVQFYWIPTPLNIEPPRRDAGRKSSGGTGCSSDNDGNGEDRAARWREVSAERRSIGNSHFYRANALTSTAADTAAAAAEARMDHLVRLQVQTALSILAQLSYVFVDGRPLANAADDGEGAAASSLGSTLTESFGAHDVRRSLVIERGGRPRSRPEVDAAGFRDAVAVASLLRQIDTYRHRIRRLFRQQLYDAEDIIGDDMAPPAPQPWLTGELGRGAYLREVQGEVKRTIGLPASTVFGCAGGGAAPPLMMSPGRHPRCDDRGMHAALLEPESGDAAPDTQVTVTEAREACATRVPWTVWQWAYRWSRLNRLLRGDSVSCLGSGGAHDTGRPSVSQAEAAAAWLPLAAGNSGSAASPTVTSSLLASCSMVALPTLATASSSSDEGFVMGGDWLTEAKLAARSKRVWLPQVLATTVPSYLENCASAGL
ncbi:putative kinesin [Leishmania infantum JPCM5]|uniref:Kinesin_-_putative n=2 Tax=Leishmania infantum TaxID=5671 RepID=A0A6L0XPK7_LEIIN|nr:putative kinesin [Leishmania infantum JPCM5]CAC9491980.1 kinesin_-_putative [Leishmania infantum]CAM68406.2 putative kinesin [Leishmania infantum JPCM5]SUZ42228.1 kinesin_-_putative [Leishmania infantum]|eukprot:XP_001465973.2 putative kinesin [Leishmania infantum JPCM5]